MVTTNDKALFERLKLFRNNGIVHNQQDAFWKYDVLEISGNYNVTEAQAALGISQLSRITDFIEKRRALVKQYRKLLSKQLPQVKLFTDEFDESSAFHLFVVQIPFSKLKIKRDQLMRQLKEKGIGTQVHYIPLYHHPYFKQRNGEVEAYFPETEAYYAEALTLPLYYDLSFEDIERVVKVLKGLLK